MTCIWNRMIKIDRKQILGKCDSTDNVTLGNFLATV